MLKEKLVANIATERLYDVRRFAHSIEAAYSEMHDRSQKGLGSEDIYIDQAEVSNETSVKMSEQPSQNDSQELINNLFDLPKTMFGSNKNKLRLSILDAIHKGKDIYPPVEIKISIFFLFNKKYD